jgi:hypothetical protein
VVDLFILGREVGRLLFDAIWKMIPSCLMWCLWKERNYQNFEDLEQTTVELEAFFF